MLYIKPYSQVVNKPTKIAGFNQQDRGDTHTTKNRWTRGYFMIIQDSELVSKNALKWG